MACPDWQSVLLEGQMSLWKEGTLLAPPIGSRLFELAQSSALHQLCKRTTAALVSLPGTLSS